MLLSVLFDKILTYSLTFRDMSLRVFSYQLFATMAETHNLHDRKATDSQIEIILMFQLPTWNYCVVASIWHR